MSADHLGDRLSAYVDGELERTEREAVEEHLGTCRSCRLDHARLVETRDLLRDLPEVRPPFGFFRRLLPRRLSWRQGLVTVTLAAIAAAAFLATMALTGGLDSLRIRPDVEGHAERHAAMAEPDAADADADGRFEPMDAPDRTPLLVGTASLGPTYEADGSWWDDDGGVVHVVYRAGSGELLSVFAEEGRVAWSRLPEDGRRVEVGSEPAWHADQAGLVVVVTEHADLVFTVVGSGPATEVLEAAAQLPDARSLGVGERLRRATADLVERFGLD